MQSNPRILVNLPVILVKTLVNLPVKLTKNEPLMGAMGGLPSASSSCQAGSGEYTRERLVRLGPTPQRLIVLPEDYWDYW